MRPHPRIRKAIKWGGAVVTVGLVMVWLLGTLWYFGIAATSHRIVIVDKGAILFGELVPVLPGKPVGLIGGAIAESNGWGYTQSLWIVPIWFVLTPVIPLTAIAWHLDTLARRRERLGVCPKCHYDRAGLAAGVVCPECGAAPVSQHPQSAR